jgi:putative two-component system response regulator
MAKAGERQARNTAFHNAKLLIVDDEPMNVLLLRDMLEQAGYHAIQSTSNPVETLAMYQAFGPDLVLLDLMMPIIDGSAVMEQLKTEGEVSADVPVLMLTADISPHTKRLALANGAKDFLTKPFDAVELLLRISNLLETRFLHRDLQTQNHSLEDRVRERTAELEAARQRIADYARQLEEAQSETLERLARAGEFRDDDTGQHTQRVGDTTAILARRLGFPAERLPWLQQAARLHDVGKIGISDLILLKPGKLTTDEFEIIKTHTTIGAELLKGGSSELFQMAQRIAASHHERWDGGGYPQGLRGEEIPLEARLLSVADVFDALTHDRPYKTAWPVADAVAEIERQSGRQFDPQVVEEFRHLPHASLL